MRALARRLGRIAFNDANASDTGTFACASCHPDGMNDQLLWRIGGACFFGACTGDDEIRSTMPVRGLRNTLPLHWEGRLGVLGAVTPIIDGHGPFMSTMGERFLLCRTPEIDEEIECLKWMV